MFGFVRLKVLFMILHGTTKLSCFKAYDIRGRIGEELSPDIAYNIGRVYAEVVSFPVK